jgi:hypothetical protein
MMTANPGTRSCSVHCFLSPARLNFQCHLEDERSLRFDCLNYFLCKDTGTSDGIYNYKKSTYTKEAMRNRFHLVAAFFLLEEAV